MFLKHGLSGLTLVQWSPTESYREGKISKPSRFCLRCKQNDGFDCIHSQKDHGKKLLIRMWVMQFTIAAQGIFDCLHGWPKLTFLSHFEPLLCNFPTNLDEGLQWPDSCQAKVDFCVCISQPWIFMRDNVLSFSPSLSLSSSAEILFWAPSTLWGCITLPLAQGRGKHVWHSQQ